MSKHKKEKDKNGEQAAYEFLRDLSMLSSEEEGKRELSLINQSNQMQTSFSFATAVIYVLLPVFIEHTAASRRYIFIAYAVVSAVLVASFVLAMLAQWRYKYETYASTYALRDHLKPYMSNLTGVGVKEGLWVDLVGKVQDAKTKLNHKRAKLISASMHCFFCALGLTLALVLIGAFVY